jgi:thiamine-phosphate pyrophosphorylase
MKPDFRLYLITDRKLFRSPEKMLVAIGEALEGGARAVQLREKDLGVRKLLALARQLRGLTQEYGALLFVNDRLDVALAAGADGVHLGGESMPVQAVRRVSGGALAIGVSAHSTGEAKKAEQDGADFIILGPVYETPSKLRYGRPVGLDVLHEATKAVTLPVFAVGGIRTGRVQELRTQGASGIALISAILGAKDVRKTTEEFMRKLS